MPPAPQDQSRPALRLTQDGPAPRADADQWAPRLGRILERQRELYERLDSLSREQSGHIERGDTDGLLGLLGQRQTVIDEISRLNDEVAPFAKDWEALSAGLSEGQRADLRRKFDVVAGLVQAITSRDDADRRLLEERRGRMGDELSAMSKARSAMNAYTRGGGRVSPRYEDRSA